ncbi:uncharacterized protein LOC129726042 [Wyeomyia smithii]|uniref:uncharacterized protein LOC129726042 n=1 Tax=Wyeomyia smithii TaxID=174621 RepID=UPI002467E053|nr:uncharacterized protein LOC129726042 [Wyeomyia smithii]
MELTQYILIGCVMLIPCSADMNININQPNADMYHQQSTGTGQFEYGYHVNTESNQFQHKAKGPDGVTYGCYGYVDPTNKKQSVYYVADQRGYRIIIPNQTTKIFARRVADSLNKLDGSLKGNDYDEKVVAWNDLYMPAPCFRLEDTLSSSASSLQQQGLRPPISPSSSSVRTDYPQQGSPKPTQYNIPTTESPAVNQGFQGQGQINDSENDLNSENDQNWADLYDIRTSARENKSRGQSGPQRFVPQQKQRS